MGLVVLLQLFFLLSQLPFAAGLGTVRLAGWAAQSTAPPMKAEAKPVIVIQAYNDGLARVRADNPDLHLSLERDPSVSEEHVLGVEYPVPTKDPAGRDVHCARDYCTKCPR